MLDVTRHSELFVPHEFKTPIHIIGVGATGSWLVMQLAKLGIKGEYINVWDFDKVEAHNVSNQLFGIHDVGKEKAIALADHVSNQTGTEIKVHNKMYTNEPLAGIVFLMVDSMKERRRIFQENIKLKPAVKHLIEPRMGLDVGRVYNVNPLNMAQVRAYEATYYEDDVAEESACGTSMTVITSAMSIASWCVRQLINHNDGTELDNEILLDFKYNNIITNQWGD